MNTKHVDNIDVVDDIEIILTPVFDSDDPHEVLGCSASACSEELDRAYRDLARKYHPEADERSSQSSNHDAESTQLIFQKVSQAYARAKGNPEVPNTPEEAKEVYENMFGKYRELYYNEGGMIGLPYSSDLREQLEKTKYYRDLMSLRLGKVGNNIVRLVFFRTWLIKKDINVYLWLCEILLTWTVTALCVITFLLEFHNPDMWPALTNNNNQIINIVGGVALMFAQFILCFWYGFTRYPAGTRHFIEWLHPPGGIRRRNLVAVEQDMEDIRSVCSYYLHQDKAQHFQPCLVWLGFPIILVEQLLAGVTSLIARAFTSLCPDEDTQSYIQHASKSIAGLIVVVGYYFLWMYGNVWCKLAGTVSLLVAQNLHNSILFEKSLFEFLQSFIFGNVLMVTFQQQPSLARVKVIQQIEETPISSYDMEDAVNNTDGMKTQEDEVSEVKTGRKEADDEMEWKIENKAFDGTSVANPFQEVDDDAAAVANAKKMAMNETTVYGRDISSVYARSFNPFGFFKSATFSGTSVQPDTPSTAQDVDSFPDQEIGSLPSYFDRGDIERMAENQREKRARNDTSLNAEEILEDLTNEESRVSASVVDSDVDEPDDVMNFYKSAKRRIEDAFFPTKIIVEEADEKSSAESKTNEKPSTLDNNVSYDFTEMDEECGMRKGDEDYSTQLPPILVIDAIKSDDDDADIKGGDQPKGNGQTEVSTVNRKPSNEDAVSKSKKPTKNWGFRRRGLIECVDEKKEAEPPVKLVYTNDLGHPPSFDDDLTCPRAEAWAESSTNSVVVAKRGSKRPPRYRSVNFAGLCCSEELLFG